MLLLPGPGSVEMNAIPVIFKLLWLLGMEDLARILGYKTPKALVYAQKAADHHKAWEILKLLQFSHDLCTDTLPTTRAGNLDHFGWGFSGHAQWAHIYSWPSATDMS